MPNRRLTVTTAALCALALIAPGAHPAAAAPSIREPVTFRAMAPPADHGFGGGTRGAWQPIAQVDTGRLDAGDADTLSGEVTPADTSQVLDATNVFPQEHRRKRFKDLKPGEDILRGMRILGEDAAAVVTGPRHMGPEDALLTLGLLGAAGTLYAYDREVLDGMHRSWDAPVYGEVVDYGARWEKLGYIGALAPYYAGGFLVTYALRLDPLPQMFAEAAESNLITGVLRNVLEMTLRRARPRENADPKTWFVKGGDSFPSGHASVVFELATIAAHHTRSVPLKIAYYAVAASVSVARAQVDSHWPSDVFLGAVIGTTVSSAIVRRHDR